VTIRVCTRYLWKWWAVRNEDTEVGCDSIFLADAQHFWHNFFRMNQGKFRISRFALVPIGLLLAGTVLLQGQQSGAAIAFEQAFPGSEPEHYVISITSDCHGAYQSEGKLTDQSAAEESFHFDFTFTPATCAKIFDLTKQAHYFQGKVDSKKKNIAATGMKTLSYKDDQRNTKATYNYSPIPAVLELTTIFQSLGATMEFGRRLEYDRRYQKLALDEDLKKMEGATGVNGLEEISAIAPTLQKIVDDPSLMNVVRARAQRLIAAGK